MVKQVCAWCKSDIAIIDERNKDEESISHGICNNCFRDIIAEESESLVDFLDGIKTPVLIATDNVKIIAANSSAQKLVGKDIDHIKSYLGGEVFECTYSKLPGGCGRTLHCKDCVIRNSTMKTLESGEPQYKKPAVLNHGDLDDINKVSLLISTEKKGDYVLIRIDEVKE